MKNPVARGTTISLIAIAVQLLLTWLPIWLGGNLIKIGTSDAVLSALGLGIEFLRNTLPGLLVGFVVSSRPALLGGIVTGVAGVLSAVWVASTAAPGFTSPSDATQAFLLGFFTGLISGGAGAYFRVRANNSFKPTPLRGVV